jgi:signal transduction histidine kinase
MGEELERLAGVLWTVGVSALILVGLALAFLIRWQLAPLAAMAREASRIQPGAAARIASSGNALEYVRLRQALNQMLERMAGALERERGFASMAAHELRSPLAQLRTGLELTLRRERQPEEYRTAMREALSDVARLEKLVSGLLQLTRLDRLENVPAAGVSLALVLRQAARTGGSAEPTGPVPPDEIHVVGDEYLLTMAVQNVLANAARYAPEAPPEWRCTVEAETVRVAISDSGPGVAEADRERIFEPLTRLEKARTIGEPSQGFGLGLAIARAAVRACLGELTCQARTDAKRGAEFVLVFKRVTSGATPGHLSAPSAERSTGGGNV